MLDGASYSALWDLWKAGGPRPEHVLPTLNIESGLNPALPNLEGYPYYGINQAAGSYLQAHGITPADYLTWPASQQIRSVVSPMMLASVASFGPLVNGVRVYQSNFWPISLRTAHLPADVIVSSRSSSASERAAYNANRMLDVDRSGAITVSDLARVVAAHVPKNPIALAYRDPSYPPSAGAEQDPVWGQSLAPPSSRARTGLWLFAAALAGGGAYAAYEYGRGR